MSHDFSYSVIDLKCTNKQRNCISKGNGEQFLSQYDPSYIYYYVAPVIENVSVAKNGTVTVKLMQQELREALGPLRMYYYNFHWNPTFDCNYELAYIDGSNYKSPNYRKINIFPCDSEICTAPFPLV